MVEAGRGNEDIALLIYTVALSFQFCPLGFPCLIPPTLCAFSSSSLQLLNESNILSPSFLFIAILSSKTSDLKVLKDSFVLSYWSFTSVFFSFLHLDICSLQTWHHVLKFCLNM